MTVISRNLWEHFQLNSNLVLFICRTCFLFNGYVHSPLFDQCHILHFFDRVSLYSWLKKEYTKFKVRPLLQYTSFPSFKSYITLQIETNIQQYFLRWSGKWESKRRRKNFVSSSTKILNYLHTEWNSRHLQAAHNLLCLTLMLQKNL